MCLIVDINVAEKALVKTDDPDFIHVHQYLNDRRDFHVKKNPSDKNEFGKLFYGGKLLEEYTRSNALIRVVMRLQQMGRARKVPDELVNAETVVVESLGLCESNDHHIVALARVANVRLLCTDDQALIADFTNKRLIDRKRGKVYRFAKHKDLLRQHCYP